MQSHNARELDVERRLGRLESPEPPADLLDRIRQEIPDHLRPASEAEGTPPARRWRYRLAAASVFLAVVGGLLAYRVVLTAPDPSRVAPAEPSSEPGAPAPAPLRQEVGDEAGERVVTAPAPPSVPAEDPTEPAPAEDELAAEPPPRAPAPAPVGEASTNEQLRERLRALPGPQRPLDRDTLEPAAVGSKEVGPPRPEAEEARADRRQTSRETTPEVHQEIVVEGRLPEVTVHSLGATAGELEDRAAKKVRAAAPTRRPAPLPTSPPAPGGAPSTGGTAEPNDQPWGDMFFRSYGTNPFVDTEDDPRSTFGLDVDSGSYTLARGYLERGHLPPPEAIRVEEFINFFDYGDPAPRRGEFTLTAEGAPSPWSRGPRYQLLRVGVHGREISAAERRDATLVFVVDVSGSMARENRIQLVKRALHLLLDQLGAGDRVGLVVYGGQGRVVLEPSGDLETVRRAVDGLSTGGSTNAEEGLVLAYDLARRYFRPEAINRLVLCSDGVANVGRTGPESILARVGREAEEGIELTTVGFGMGNYNDVLMEQLADQGDGNYAYVDTLAEARRVFVENLTGTLQTIASDAKIQVEFDPRVVTRYRLLGYENRDVADHRFRDDTVDAGEIGAGHRVTALYEIKLAAKAPRRGAVAEVRLRYRSKATGRVVEDSLEVRRSDLARSWRSAAPSLRLAALAAELAEVLKRSYWVRETRPESLRARADAVRHGLGGERDVDELVDLVYRASSLIDWRDELPGPREPQE